jgi:hypothetical protein
MTTAQQNKIDQWNRESGINIAKALDSHSVISHNISEQMKFMPAFYSSAGIYIFNDSVMLCTKTGSQTSIIQL